MSIKLVRALLGEGKTGEHDLHTFESCLLEVFCRRAYASEGYGSPYSHVELAVFSSLEVSLHASHNVIEGHVASYHGVAEVVICCVLENL